MISKLLVVKDADAEIACCSGGGEPDRARHPRGGQATLRPGRAGSRRAARNPRVVARRQPVWAERIRSRAISMPPSRPPDFLPAGLAVSFGCGNPTALAELQPGETVLDLGSGGGIDVLLSARRVGPTGKAYGLDMTDEMIGLAEQEQTQGRRNQRRVPERNHRRHPAARRRGGCDHFELRDQPVGRQGQGSARSLSRAQAGWPLRGVRHRSSPRIARVGAQVHDPMDRVCRGGSGGK